jgi:hypothetical protein
MKISVSVSLIAFVLSGCTAEQAREFSNGLNSSLAQGREQRCEVGTQCFANLSPEAQQAILNRDRPQKKQSYTCYTTDSGITQCTEN